MFVRSIREANFRLYQEVLQVLTPCFFAMDHTNYARWASVHICDMCQLESIHPVIYAAFQRGAFTVQISVHKFSAISLDHAHEQNNEMVKGDGGAIGLTENSSALHRWMVGGPQMAKLVQVFEDGREDKSTCTKTTHHEQTEASQNRFREHTYALFKYIKDIGKSF